mmetsp:Transcript_11258/g.26913  ORF Transcript_11258/g.26913 Transcript_11258/m.26913 type:complete len:242 (-) Transcript_11258:1954-2679(-)
MGYPVTPMCTLSSSTRPTTAVHLFPLRKNTSQPHTAVHNLPHWVTLTCYQFTSSPPANSQKLQYILPWFSGLDALNRMTQRIKILWSRSEHHPAPSNSANSSAAARQADSVVRVCCSHRLGVRCCNRGHVHGELDGICCCLAAEIVLTGLQPPSPAVEMHRRELGCSYVRHVNVQGLRLVNVWATVSSHINNGSLLDLPYSLVDLAQFLRDLFDALHRSICGHDTLLQSIVPATELDQVLH